MNTPSVGAYFQCFKQPRSTLATIASFRAHYPTGTIVVASDGGYNYRDACNHYGCIYRSYDRMGTDIGVVTSARENIIIWINRLLDAARQIPDDYIMILEDDVRVFAPATNLEYDCNGINTEVRIGKKLTAFLKSRNQHIPKEVSNYYFGGCGGAIVRKSFILEHFIDIEQAITEIESYQDDSMKGSYVSDYWLSVLILYYGGSLGPYQGFCETWHLSYPIHRYLLRDITTLHFDKTLHNKPLSETDTQILGPSFSPADRADYQKKVTLRTPLNIRLPFLTMLRSRLLRFFNRLSF